MKFKNKLGLYIILALILADDATAVYTGHQSPMEFMIFVGILAIGGWLLLYDKKQN